MSPSGSTSVGTGGGATATSTERVDGVSTAASGIVTTTSPVGDVTTPPPASTTVPPAAPRSKVASTAVVPSTAIVQAPGPAQAPDHPRKLDVGSGWTVSVATVGGVVRGTGKMQPTWLGPQLIVGLPGTSAEMLPDPVPVRATVSIQLLPFVKTATTVLSAPAVSVQDPVPEQSPAHP